MQASSVIFDTALAVICLTTRRFEHRSFLKKASKGLSGEVWRVQLGKDSHKM